MLGDNNLMDAKKAPHRAADSSNDPLGQFAESDAV